MSNIPASKSKWGVRKERTPAELNQLCHEALNGLKLPKEWEFQKYDWCVDDNGTVLSVGAVFLDKRTSGVNIKYYRAFFHTWSERLGIVENYFIDFGERANTCLVSNKTIEDMNVYIYDNFSKDARPCVSSPCVSSPCVSDNNDNENDNLKNLIDKIATL